MIRPLALAAALLALPARGATLSDAARIAPGAVDAALLLPEAGALEGLRAFLETAGRLSQPLAPGELGRLCAARFGVDLLRSDGVGRAAGAELPWGLAPGPRAAIVVGRSAGFTGPVGNQAAAKKALAAWLGDAGKPRKAGRALAAGRGRSTRAGLIAPVMGARRLLLATGPEADKLVELMALVGRGKRPLARRPEVRLALPRLVGAAALFARGEGPVKGALLALDGSANELSAKGFVVPQRGALLSGAPPSEAACARGPLFCARAGAGPAGQAALAAIARQWTSLAVGGARGALLSKALDAALAHLTGPVALRLEQLDVDRLGALSDPAWAVPFTAAAHHDGFELDGLSKLPSGVRRKGGTLTVDADRTLCLRAGEHTVTFTDVCEGPPIDAAPAGGAADAIATLDAQALARQLGQATPLTALRGPLSAAAYTARLLFGKLLAASEPIVARGRPASGMRGAAQVEVRWRLTTD